MSWFFWALLSSVTSSFEEIVDKIAIIKKTNEIDALVASFLRNLVFFFFTILIGLLGYAGNIQFVFNIHFLIIAMLWPLNSLAYDYFLRKVEISRFNAFFYSFPFVFLLIDNIYFHVSFSVIGVVGILLLVIGSILFTIDIHQKKTVMNAKGFIWILLKMASYAYLLFAYKFFETSVNEVSFYSSIWLIIVLFYLLILLFSGKCKDLLQVRTQERFLGLTFLSKGFDALSSVFYLKALYLTSLTAVSAFMSFSPVILLLILFCISLLTKIDIQEDLSRKSVAYKLAATIVLTIGGFCIFFQ